MSTSGTGRVGRWVLDLAVVVALVSAVVMLLQGREEPALRFVVVAAAVVAARWGGVPSPFSAAFAVFLLVATWAWSRHWYRDIDEFDVVVHFFTPGSLAAVSYFLLVRLRVLPSVRELPPGLRTWSVVVWVTTVGVTAAVLWEFYEWVVEQVDPAGMTVGYDDTVLDLLAGLLGSLVAGGLVLWWGRRRDSAADASDVPASGRGAPGHGGASVPWRPSA